MLRMAVTTEAETFRRLSNVLPERGIDVEYLQVDERLLALSPDDAPWKRDRFDVGFVYPSRLMEGGVADALLDLPWVNGRRAVLTSRNKAGVLARLAAAGIPTARSVLVSNPVTDAERIDVFDRFDGPVVVKPNSTTRGLGVARADDVDSYVGITDYLGLIHEYPATGDRSYLVQEYVPGARDLRIMVIDGTYAGAVERAQPRDGADHWKHNVHRGADATGIRPDAACREIAEAVAAELDIPFLGVDLLVHEEGPIVSETNARPTVDTLGKYEAAFLDRLTVLIEGSAR